MPLELVPSKCRTGCTLAAVLASLKSTTAQLNSLIDKIRKAVTDAVSNLDAISAKSSGSAGKLLTSNGLYDVLLNTVHNINYLVKDIQ